MSWTEYPRIIKPKSVKNDEETEINTLEGPDTIIYGVPTPLKTSMYSPDDAVRYEDRPHYDICRCSDPNCLNWHINDNQMMSENGIIGLKRRRTSINLDKISEELSEMKKGGAIAVFGRSFDQPQYDIDHKTWIHTLNKSNAGYIDRHMQDLPLMDKVIKTVESHYKEQKEYGIWVAILIITMTILLAIIAGVLQ